MQTHVLLVAATLGLCSSSLVSAQTFPTLYPHNFVSYESGGLMTRPTKMLVDLDAGTGWIAQAPASVGTFGAILPPSRIVQVEPRQLAGLRQLASKAVSGGMETQRCQQARARKVKRGLIDLPQMHMDRFESFLLSFQGKSLSAPADADCRMPVVDQLYGQLTDSLATQ